MPRYLLPLQEPSRTRQLLSYLAHKLVNVPISALLDWWEVGKARRKK